MARHNHLRTCWGWSALLRRRNAYASAPSSWAPFCASASAPPAWAPCSSTSSGSVRRHVQVLQLRRVGHRVVQVLQPCQRGHRVRAPLASVCGAMCKCFSSVELATVLCKCFSSASVGTVFELLWRQRAAPCASASAPPAWAPCSCSSSGSVRRHVQVLQRRQRGHRVRAPLAAACGAMCKCFSSANVGTVAGLRAVCRGPACHLPACHRVRAPLAAACGTVCECFSSASVGSVFELH